MSRQTGFAGWVDNHGSTMETLDFQAPVDDLEPLRDIVGGAQVVALGESSHHIRAFYQVRHRILRFLVERCGFEVCALEAPFTERQILDARVQGGPGTVEQVAAEGIALSLGRCREMHEALRRMREHNRAAAVPPLRCVGTDLPGSAASPLPTLEKLAGYLRWAAPEALPELEEAVGVVRRFDDPIVFAAISRYENLDPDQRDVLTGALSQLMAHMQRLTPVQHARGTGPSTTRRCGIYAAPGISFISIAPTPPKVSSPPRRSVTSTWRSPCCALSKAARVWCWPRTTGTSSARPRWTARSACFCRPAPTSQPPWGTTTGPSG
jgi:erythromycin esterase